MRGIHQLLLVAIRRQMVSFIGTESPRDNHLPSVSVQQSWPQQRDYYTCYLKSEIRSTLFALLVYQGQLIRGPRKTSAIELLYFPGRKATEATTLRRPALLRTAGIPIIGT